VQDDGKTECPTGAAVETFQAILFEFGQGNVFLKFQPLIMARPHALLFLRRVRVFQDKGQGRQTDQVGSQGAPHIIDRHHANWYCLHDVFFLFYCFLLFAGSQP